MEKSKEIGVGLIGFGTVGTGVWKILHENEKLLRARAPGLPPLKIRRIAVRDLSKSRATEAPTNLFTTKWQDVVSDPACNLIIELIGGTSTAFDLVAEALRQGKPVITGNKALLAERGAELWEISQQHQTPIYFEAAVAGGIPIINAIQNALIGNRITSIAGIINGTSNYILERMTTGGLDYPTALSEAQEKGYAEADPALDVNGWDAAHKAIILAILSYGFPIDPKSIYVTGIEAVSRLDIKFAERLGYVIKLLSVVRQHSDSSVEIRTQPSFIPQGHILAGVHGVFNAVSLCGDALGEAMFYGRGAGSGPTASSVVGDLLQAAKNYSSGENTQQQGFLPYKKEGQIIPIEETRTAYYLRCHVTDKPGVLAEIARLLADEGLTLSGTHSLVDPNDPDAEFVHCVFLLHTCPYGQMLTALKKVRELQTLQEPPTFYRIEKLNS